MPASLLAAGMPLLNAIIGVLIGVTGLHALSGLIDVSETAPILATMLGLAVGIDYALFILSRHREGMEKGSSPRKRRRRPPLPQAAPWCSPAPPSSSRWSAWSSSGSRS